MRTLLLLLCMLQPVPALAQAAAPVPLSDFFALAGGDDRRAVTAATHIAERWRAAYATMLLELVVLAPSATQARILELLRRGSGQRFGAELDRWYEWIWRMDPGTHPDYSEFKATLYEAIDPRFRAYFDEAPKTAIRLDEIRWGGVRRDGIPPLDHPKLLPAGEAAYLGDGDVVFGIEWKGDVRAYPKRIMAWHEMVRDRIGGEELNGVYCTLCGSMIFYRATVQGTHHVLGTSGFLYRSNKLMYDRATESLWSTLTGTPVVGPLVGRGIELEPLFVVTTTWGEWRKLHPDTRVLSLDTGHQRDYGEGVAYRDYFATDRLMFGVPRLDDRLPNKAEILALRVPGSAREPLAISAGFLRRRPVYQDRIGRVEFVVLTDGSGANRVYASGGRRFVSWGGTTAVDADGARWTVSEAALTRSDGTRLARLPAHRAFWFGWYAAYPDTRLVK
ncbi:MAG: DUF3179 domain-containing protein [Gemmatimonadota bacterium]|nr:DUF3179 domain-containing protein [Gemmatimonadota bacterium]